MTAQTSVPPLEATNLACSNIGTDSLTLAWTPSTSASLDSQNLYRDAIKINSFPKTTSTVNVTGLSPATTYLFNLTSLNLNGDESGGVNVSCQTAAGGNNDVTPPVGTVLINNNATYTTSNIVNLNLTTDDAVEMRFRNSLTGTWSNYEPYSATRLNWDLNNALYGGTSLQGVKNVYVQMRDAKGNETAFNITDSIIFDSLTPVSTANPLGGRYATNQNVVLSSEPNATIKYATKVAVACTDASVVYSTYTAPIAITD